MKVQRSLSLASRASLVFFASSTSWMSHAATVAVIDSGIDYKHRDLTSHMWLNDADDADNRVDDDGNGYIDDVFGWNFAEDNNQVIDYQYLDQFSEDCYKFFGIQGRIISGTATADDRAWYDAKRADASFMQELATFGNFVHGSHVAGIASRSRSQERLLAVKIIATRPGLGVLDVERLSQAVQAQEVDDPLTKQLIQWMINSIVDRQVGVIVKAGEYVAARRADVANGSFGVSYAAAGNAVKSILQALLGREPTADEQKEYTNYMISRINEKCRAFVKQAPHTVFVFAAGNDGTNNDDQAMAPANVGEPNVLSVAATLGVASLASFSNFGVRTVDVAAPGVVINSTIPGDRYLEMSGTSMAAPYVTEVAALVKDANPRLTAVEIKRIIVETVDAKPYLTKRVRSGGIVNDRRAVEAAKASVTHELGEAIRLAKAVPDMAESLPISESARTFVVTPIPLPSLLP